MITVYTVAFNEEVFIKFMIDHYRSRFPNCHIVVHDNESTDNTVAIAMANNCEVITYSTNNQINDSKYLEIKNNCWKKAQTDWVLICDVDELLNINESDLLAEENLGVTMISSEGYNMVNMEDNYDLENIKYGARCEPYDKFYLFNKKFISDINYKPGCHECKPIGKAVKSKTKYIAYHYKCINPDFQVERYASYAGRLSEENKKNGWGNHYLQTPEQIKGAFYAARQYVKRIIL